MPPFSDFLNIWGDCLNDRYYHIMIDSHEPLDPAALRLLERLVKDLDRVDLINAVVE